ncbi:hypothetical protein B9G98_01778 [Wickerhamiella sorbophila]|uniref:MAGE domain-containing protein n=1 Tax=Wickerhamiella sorbophila TaxID=45607 RepID=A0A2T0FGN8_9ASCO|nr:hypothetical protein B9G98_01778 [Wickerhamiella sorbophila]PRT54158.1 hypothetical protein B9G98_01778 [Wickerhamiella sorbophila]
MDHRSKRPRQEVEVSTDHHYSVIRYLLACQATGKPINKLQLREAVGSEYAANLKNAKKILELKYAMTIKEIGPNEMCLVSTLDEPYRSLVSKAATAENTTFNAILVFVNVLLLLDQGSTQLREIKQSLRSRGIELTDAMAQNMLRWRYFEKDDAITIDEPAVGDEDIARRDLVHWRIGKRSTLVFSADQILRVMATVLWPKEPSVDEISRIYPGEYNYLKSLVERSAFSK